MAQKRPSVAVRYLNQALALNPATPIFGTPWLQPMPMGAIHRRRLISSASWSTTSRTLRWRISIWLAFMRAGSVSPSRLTSIALHCGSILIMT